MVNMNTTWCWWVSSSMTSLVITHMFLTGHCAQTHLCCASWFVSHIMLSSSRRLDSNLLHGLYMPFSPLPPYWLKLNQARKCHTYLAWFENDWTTTEILKQYPSSVCRYGRCKEYFDYSNEARRECQERNLTCSTMTILQAAEETDPLIPLSCPNLSVLYSFCNCLSQMPCYVANFSYAQFSVK